MRYREYQVSQVAHGPKASRYERINAARSAERERVRNQLIANGGRHVIGAENYIIMPSGTLYSLNCTRVIPIRPGKKPGGYMFAGLASGGHTRWRMIHRLVAEAFIPNPLGLPEINHKDGDKDNNAAFNLEWCTRAHNTRHAFTIGLMGSGTKSKSAKLTAIQVIEIRAAVGRYRDIGAQYGVSAQTVCNVKRRTNYKDVAEAPA